LPPDTRAGKGYLARAVGSFVPKVAGAVFERFGFHSAEIMTSWDTIVGADLARLTRPEAIRWPRGAKSRIATEEDGGRAGGATLVIGCDPAFALEVSYRTEDIIDRINRYFGYRAIAQLRVVQMPGTAGAAAQPSSQPATGRLATSDESPAKTLDLEGALAALGLNIVAATSRS
jgi:hypothetical protein